MQSDRQRAYSESNHDKTDTNILPHKIPKNCYDSKERNGKKLRVFLEIKLRESKTELHSSLESIGIQFVS